MSIMTNKIIVFLFCLFQINFLYSQVESERLEKTDTKSGSDSIVQIFYPIIHGVKYDIITDVGDSMVFLEEEKIRIVYDKYRTTYYHYDSLNRIKMDSIVYNKGKFTKYFHYVNGKIELKYTYYHDLDINISYTETINDSVAIFNIIRFKDNDTVVQRDTIFLYYPNTGTSEYYDNNLTLEALNENRFSQMDTPENFMRIFMVHFRDTIFSVVLYTISDIFKYPLSITKKTGDYLSLSLFESKENLIKKYVYEFTHKKTVNKKINKTLKKITSFKSLPVRDVDPDIDFDNLLVEYVVNGRYYYFVSSYNFCYSYIGDYFGEEREVLKLIIKLVTYLDNAF